MRKAFKYRLYPSEEQHEALTGQLREACSLYNAAKQERDDAWKTCRIAINYYDQANQLKELRSLGLTGLANYSCCQDVLRRVDKTYKAFFARVKRGEQPGFPRYKSARRYDSITVPSYGDGCKLLDNGRLRIQGAGEIKVKLHRSIEGKIKTVAIKREADRWFVVFSVECDAQPLPLSTDAVGIDVGLDSFATLSDGSEIDNPRYYRKAETGLRRYQRMVARRKKGSNRRRKAVRFLQRAHIHVRNQRADFLHNVSRGLVNKYGAIAVEDLNVKGLAGGMLAKSVHDAGWSMFLFLLLYKAASAGRQVIKVDPRGTSQTCLCGAHVSKTLADRWHKCPACGLSAARDHVSAQVILQRAGTRPSGANVCVAFDATNAVHRQSRRASFYRVNSRQGFSYNECSSRRHTVFVCARRLPKSWKVGIRVTSSRKSILVLEDEAVLRESVCQYLSVCGYEARGVGPCKEVRAVIREIQPAAAILDYLLPDGTALDVIRMLHELDPLMPVIVLTGYASIDIAVQAVKSGAEQFVTKPIELHALGSILERALQDREAASRRAVSIRATPHESYVDPFVGSSSAIQSLKQQACRISATDCSVLILGETGSGKGVLANWLHHNSKRHKHPIVDLNCAGLAKELLENELFGHEKGAFTGALSAKTGLLEYSNFGSLFLDEIGDMDLQVQSKLLKVIEEKRFRRLGDFRERQTDVRLISATHHNITSLVQEKKFRSDLYFRIATVVLRVPSLSERTEDIIPLTERLLRQLAVAHDREALELTPEATKALQIHSWPGNIRELRNVLERAVLLCPDRAISHKDITFDDYGAPVQVSELSLTLREVQAKHIKRVLERELGDVDRAAASLDVPRSTLYQKIRALHLKTTGGQDDS